MKITLLDSILRKLNESDFDIGSEFLAEALEITERRCQRYCNHLEEEGYINLETLDYLGQGFFNPSITPKGASFIESGGYEAKQLIKENEKEMMKNQLVFFQTSIARNEKQIKVLKDKYLIQWIALGISILAFLVALLK